MPLLLLLRQRLDSRQLLSFQELERSTATGRDMGNLVRDIRRLYRRDRVSAADDRSRTAVIRNRMSDLECALREAWHFKVAHRPVPNDCAGIGDRVRKQFDCLR